MTSFMPKPDEIERNWYVIDAAGKPLGKVAAQAATLLRGKHKPIFTPHIDCGDYVIIINTDKAILTGNKLDNKVYYHFTGYIGNMKSTKYRILMKDKSDFAMNLAVKRMLPNTTIGRKQLTRCKIYKNDQHKHEAQKPVACEI